MAYNIITYCSSDYFEWLPNVVCSWDKPGVDKIYIYTDGGIPELPESVYGKTRVCHDYFGPCTNFRENCSRKAESLHYCLSSNTSGNFLMIDSDCYLAEDVSTVFDKCFDIAVTVLLETTEAKRFNDISAGLLFVKNTDFSKRFVERWIDKQMQLRSKCADQQSLSRTCKENMDQLMGLDAEVYNSYPYTNSPGEIYHWYNRIRKNSPKILHFAHRLVRDKKFIDDTLNFLGQ